jgi:hypothetical protein
MRRNLLIVRGWFDTFNWRKLLNLLADLLPLLISGSKVRVLVRPPLISDVSDVRLGGAGGAQAGLGVQGTPMFGEP